MSTADLPLSNSKNNFERAMVDVTTNRTQEARVYSHDEPTRVVECILAVIGTGGPIQIGHNGKGLGAGWHLDHVE
eukprot:9000848-Pyramimonas_sp.AAC.1